MSHLDGLLSKIYYKYVSIKMDENNFLLEDLSDIQNNFTDKVYNSEELISIIDKKKNLILNDKKYVYGEIKKQGVEILLSEINKHNTKNLDTFIDVGSGTGKVCFHMSLISDFETIVGIEIVTGRHQYALELMEKINYDFDNVVLLNDDILQIDFEKPVIVFADDVCFPQQLTEMIYENLPTGSHFISFKHLKNPISKILLDVTWDRQGCWFNYYIKT